MRLYSSYTHTPTHTHTYRSISKWSGYWKLTALSTSTPVFQYSIVSTHGEGDGTPSRTLAWKIPWMEEPGGLQPMGSLGVGHDLATSLSHFTFMHWRRKWQPTPVFLPGESQGRGAWWAAIYGAAQSRTRLKRLSSSSSTPSEYWVLPLLSSMPIDLACHGASDYVLGSEAN